MDNSSHARFFYLRRNGKELRNRIKQEDPGDLNVTENDDDMEDSPRSRSIASMTSTPGQAPAPQYPSKGQAPPKKAKTVSSKTPMRFRWTTEMVDTLVNCLHEEKTRLEFKGLDFESDLVRLYGSIRITMSECYENGQFGVVSVGEMEDGLDSGERGVCEKLRIQEEKKGIKLGYERVKTKTKEIRQSYRKAVSEGRQSGSGRIVCDNWEKLKSIWGGSPATKSVERSVFSYLQEDEYSDNEQAYVNSVTEDLIQEDSSEARDTDAAEDNVSSPANEENATNRNSNPTRKLVDNKRKNVKKRLTASQRDNIYMKMAQDQLILNQNLVDQLTAATAKSNRALEKLSESIESAGKSIGEGLNLLAGAFNRVTPQPQG